MTDCWKEIDEISWCFLSFLQNLSGEIIISVLFWFFLLFIKLVILSISCIFGRLFVLLERRPYVFNFTSCKAKNPIFQCRKIKKNRKWSYLALLVSCSFSYLSIRFPTQKNRQKIRNSYRRNRCLYILDISSSWVPGKIRALFKPKRSTGTTT